MGMMNNCWYTVKPEISEESGGIASILFRHPVEPGIRDGGWVRLSESEKINEAKQEAGAPEKQFTRAGDRETQHSRRLLDSCTCTVGGKVYDATSVLAWHPGGQAAITGHGGTVWQATTVEINSIHDGYAQQKLKEGILGVVTEKAANFIQQNAERAAEEAVSSSSNSPDVILQKHRWVAVKLSKRVELSKDTRRYS
ncbi:putative nitrate reductase [Diplocarpon rosae]|nr:putative nitrate reductase [Diplocarpon rosae]